MYSEHQQRIEEYAFSSDKGFSRVVLFVALTIQQPLDRVKNSMSDVIRNGDKSAHLWGIKGKCYSYAHEHSTDLRRAFMEIEDVEVAMGLALSIPGLGLPKAGFLCQMLGFNVGCFDVHNIKRFGMKLNDFKLNKKSTTFTRSKKIKQYCNLCVSLGGAENLWDGWCDHVATKAKDGGRYNVKLDTAEKVSFEHLVALGLDR